MSVICEHKVPLAEVYSQLGYSEYSSFSHAYKKHFGVRLENSCYMKDGKIHSFVKMNYEKKLIEFDMLTEQERI